MIRLVKTRDIQDIATVHVTSWKETYLGIVKDHVLDQLSLDKSVQLWSAVMNDPNQRIYVYEENLQVLGFADFYFPKQSNIGEIKALYLLKQVQGKGVGRQLMELGFKIFRELHYDYVELEVFNKNQNHIFYEHLGGVLVGESDAAEYGDGLKDYKYRYTL